MKKLFYVRTLIKVLILIIILTTTVLADQFDKTIIIENKNTQLQNYDRTLGLFATKVGDANKTIQVRDRDAGLIVINTWIGCKALSQWGMGEMDLHFTLTVNTKKDKVRLRFENFVNYYNGSPNPWDYAKVDTQEKLDKTYNECLYLVVSEIEKSLNKSDDF